MESWTSVALQCTHIDLMYSVQGGPKSKPQTLWLTFLAHPVHVNDTRAERHGKLKVRGHLPIYCCYVAMSTQHAVASLTSSTIASCQ